MEEGDVCPITLEPPVDPVRAPCCGKVFSRLPLERALLVSPRCPMCRADMKMAERRGRRNEGTLKIRYKRTRDGGGWRLSKPVDDKWLTDTVSGELDGSAPELICARARVPLRPLAYAAGTIPLEADDPTLGELIERVRAVGKDAVQVWYRRRPSRAPPHSPRERAEQSSAKRAKPEQLPSPRRGAGNPISFRRDPLRQYEAWSPSPESVLVGDAYVPSADAHVKALRCDPRRAAIWDARTRGHLTWRLDNFTDADRDVMRRWAPRVHAVTPPRSAMLEASRDWNQACGVCFRECAAGERPLFSVAPTDLGAAEGTRLATSFYPDTPVSDRRISVLSRFFTRESPRRGPCVSPVQRTCRTPA